MNHNWELQGALVEARSFQICPHPVFIIGSPRSGTTILGNSLGRHPEFWDAGETQLLWDLFASGCAEANFRRGEVGWLRRQGIDRPEFLAHLGLGLNELVTSRSEGRRWIDQTPAYTMLCDLLFAMFPGARFVHVLRDGRSVVHSMVNYVNPSARDPESPAEPWAKDFHQACRVWSEYATAAMDFCALHPDRVLTVVLEDLVGDPRGGLARVLGFLGAAYDEAPARFFKSNRVNSSFEGGPPESPGAVWSGWSPEQREVFSEEAGRVLARYDRVREELERLAVSVEAGGDRLG